ncbi:MAG: CvpA family protein [Rhizobiaceae bacterium]|jgi:membrane protein required for colicin V production|nr:CvpA family protein [Rhizobiaceae bacterium]
MSLTLLDLIVIGVTLFSAVLAMVRGFSREVLAVASWAAAAAAAFLFYKPVVPLLQPYIDSNTIATVAAAGLVFLLVLIIVTLVTMKIADFIIDSRIGALDRALGFVFGAARGVLLLVVAMLFFNWLVADNQPDWIASSKAKPWLDDLGTRLIAAMPEDPQGIIMERLNPGGTGPAEGVDGQQPAGGSNTSG